MINSSAGPYPLKINSKNDFIFAAASSLEISGTYSFQLVVTVPNDGIEDASSKV